MGQNSDGPRQEKQATRQRGGKIRFRKNHHRRSVDVHRNGFFLGALQFRFDGASDSHKAATGRAFPDVGIDWFQKPWGAWTDGVEAVASVRDFLYAPNVSSEYAYTHELY